MKAMTLKEVRTAAVEVAKKYVNDMRMELVLAPLFKEYIYSKDIKALLQLMQDDRFEVFDDLRHGYVAPYYKALLAEEARQERERVAANKAAREAKEAKKPLRQTPFDKLAFLK